jgi:hypothetical protein
MIVNLAWPVSDGRQRITSVIVRVPSPSIELDQPPRGVNRLAWRIAQISGLSVETAALINLDDAEAIVDAYEIVATRFCETAHVIAGAAKTMRELAAPAAERA